MQCGYIEVTKGCAPCRLAMLWIPPRKHFFHNVITIFKSARQQLAVMESKTNLHMPSYSGSKCLNPNNYYKSVL